MRFLLRNARAFDFIVNEYVTYDKKYICDGNNLTMFETDVTTIA